MPDRFIYDEKTTKASVILNSTIEAQKQEQDNEREQKNKTKKQNNQKVYHRTMVQSM